MVKSFFLPIFSPKEKQLLRLKKIYQISNTDYRCVLTAADGQVIFID